ncbi:hypothetical protein Glove_25g36 [Diversispora epigaea]|uniref:Protein kinase domain-containing protein n=1 Tax=Diversispora epigaea TaxID=1348612 RepID=A0A397JTM1_9GLOM|nr:hypothetical protein Glove_25g36 [Diversispora epigaea]
MVCSECNQGYRHLTWCRPCNSKHFKNDFDKWTSRNDTIDKFIQDSQLNANYRFGVIEWIPYDRLEYIKQIAKGGFGTIHLAKWIDGPIEKWDIENQQWKRGGQYEVALKKFDNFASLNDNFLNEITIHLKAASNNFASIKCFGITQDPETQKYMMVLRYAKDGNLRDYLKNHFNNIKWERKLHYLRNLAVNFKKIHKLDIVHQDFHPGNILLDDFLDFPYLHITDFGLSKLIGPNLINPEKKNIFGVLPYVAPEVLSGEEHTKAADVYSFGIVTYEIITGIPPYHDIPHNKDLEVKICNGLRPKIPFHTPKLITRMIMRCWDSRVTHRPTFEELNDRFSEYYWDKNNRDSEIAIQIKEFSPSTKTITTTTSLDYKTHPQAIYTSRLLNLSSLPKPKNDENFEKELEELTKSISDLSTTDSGMIDLNISNFKIY